MLACAESVTCTAAFAQNNPPAQLVPVQAMYNHRAIQLSFLVACMYTAVGATNLGFLTNFLPHSVIGGFTSGAAISEWRLTASCAGCTLRAESCNSMLVSPVECCWWRILCNLNFTPALVRLSPLLLHAVIGMSQVGGVPVLRSVQIGLISCLFPVSSRPASPLPVLCMCCCSAAQAVQPAVLCCAVLWLVLIAAQVHPWLQH